MDTVLGCITGFYLSGGAVVSLPIVWTSKLDGKYDITVYRTNAYQGRLYVSLEGTQLFAQDVGLMYDAVFGPDIDDVMKWQEIAIKYVDGLENESKPDKASKNE